MKYFRRFRMEFTFAERTLETPILPDGYCFIAWDPRDVDRHAVTKFHSFHQELDAEVFPSLSTLDGCRRLMIEIASQKTFLPAATWLVCTSGRADSSGATADCGIIQGLANSREAGSVQNIGVARNFRSLGIGRALLVKSLHGFRDHGLRRVYLEATAENTPAVELYRSVGFRLIRTTYRQVAERPSAVSTPADDS